MTLTNGYLCSAIIPSKWSNIKYKPKIGHPWILIWCRYKENGLKREMIYKNLQSKVNKFADGCLVNISVWNIAKIEKIIIANLQTEQGSTIYATESNSNSTIRKIRMSEDDLNVNGKLVHCGVNYPYNKIYL